MRNNSSIFLSPKFYRNLVFPWLPKRKFSQKKYWTGWLLLFFIDCFWNFGAVSLNVNVCWHYYYFYHYYFFFGLHQPCHPPFRFQTLLPLKSNIFHMKTIAFFFAGITNLMCFIWLVDKFHFLPRCFSFLSCSVTLPVSNVTEYTRFIEWCFRAIPIRRSRRQQVCWNAERLVSLMTDVKALMSSWALQYVSWTTGIKRPDQRTLSRTRTDITWQKIQTEVIALANIKQ